MRKSLLLTGLAALVAIAATIMPSDADARAGGARSAAARFTPPVHGVDLRTRFNHELARRLQLRCHHIRRTQGPRLRCG